VAGKPAPQSARPLPTVARPASRNVQPCNFRSAGRLSNESARALSGLHETLARNLANSLDVYLGVGLEVKLASVEQLAMEDYKAICGNAGYVMPCSMKPSPNMVLLEIGNTLMFTIVDLLLGGTGAASEEARELTDIDQEIMLGAVAIIVQQMEQAWKPSIVSLTPTACVKPMLAHKAFPPTEKVLRIRFDLTLAEMTGEFYLSIPGSFGGHLVRNIRTEISSTLGTRYFQRPSLQQRLLDCSFQLEGVLPRLQVRVRELAAIQKGSILKLNSTMSTSGRLMLEKKPLFEASPVRQNNKKAVQLLSVVPPASWQED
jgi:flagellar motor switch protein FliM